MVLYMAFTSVEWFLDTDSLHAIREKLALKNKILFALTQLPMQFRKMWVLYFNSMARLFYQLLNCRIPTLVPALCAGPSHTSAVFNE